MEWLMKILNCIQDLWSKHKAKIAKIGAAIGVFFASIGIFDLYRANRTNNEAKIIRDNAVKQYKDSEEKTIDALKMLGELQIAVCETFPRFVNAMEKLNKPSKGLAKIINKNDIPKYNPDELIELSNTVRMVIGGAGGVGTGVAAGIAAYGVNAAMLGPGAFVGGLVLCVKGANLFRNAVENKRQALKIQKDVEKITQYYVKLRESAEVLYESMNKLYEPYISHLTMIEELAETMIEKKKYTAEEKKLIKNAARIVNLMNHMCKVSLVCKAKDENAIETVNSNEVNRLVKQNNELLGALL